MSPPLDARIYAFTDLESVFAKIDPTQDLAFDSETTSKYGKIRLAQFYQRGWDQVLMVNWPDSFELFVMLNKLSDCNIVMQFAHYDISTIQANTGARWCPETFSDTFLLARLALPHLDKYSLDELTMYTLGEDPYKKAGIDKKAMQKASWKAISLPEKQLLYAAIDVYHLLDLYDKVKVAHEDMCYKLDMHTLRYCLDFQCNGLPVEEEKCMAMANKNQTEIEELALPINPNSWQQVRPYINSNESDDLALARLALEGNERAASVRRARKLIKQNSFLNKFVTGESRIFGHFMPSARSGRLTSSDQNLQQLPRATKGVFGVTPDSDRVLLYSDYSQLELRCIGSLVNEPAIIGLYKNGEDLHNYVAKMIFGENYNKTDRRIAKTCNFNLLYGGGAGMLQSILLKDANILMPIERLKVITRKWKRLFRAIAAWQEKGIRAYHRGTLGETPMGRRYLAKLMTDQLNIENQGFGSETAKLAMHYMVPHLKDYNAQLDNFVHDSYIIEMDNDPDQYKKCAKMVAEAMREAWSEASKMVDFQHMPMPVKVFVGHNWGDIEAGQFFHEHRIEK